MVFLVIADLLHDAESDLFVIDICSCSGFAVNKNEIILDRGFNSHVGIRILTDRFVENGIRNQVAYLVRMSAGDGFR